MTERKVNFILLVVLILVFLDTGGLLYRVNSLSFISTAKVEKTAVPKVTKKKIEENSSLELIRKTINTPLVSIQDIFWVKEKTKVKKPQLPSNTVSDQKKTKTTQQMVAPKKEITPPVLFLIGYFKKEGVPYFYARSERGELLKLKAGDKVSDFKVKSVTEKGMILEKEGKEFQIKFKE